MDHMREVQEVPSRILDAVSGVVVGKDEVKRLVMLAMLCGGHILIEGIPGTAKTLLGKTFAQSIGGEFKRIQLTADLLPADVTGFYLYRPDGEARFVRGPIFANVVLADELNRTTPRTQAAFLEAMQENQVTIEGERYTLPQPFLVIASQLPAGAEGTYPLTDVQIDRFLFRAWSGYPSRDEEAGVLERIDQLERASVAAVATVEEIRVTQDLARQVHVAPEIRSYILDLIGGVRRDPDVASAPSPRGTIALYKGARAAAFLDARDFVVPDDVKQLAHQALAHRIRVKAEAELDGVGADAIVSRALERTEVPKQGR